MRMRKVSIELLHNAIGIPDADPMQTEQQSAENLEKLKRMLPDIIKDQLTDKQKYAIYKHYFDRLSQTEIAERMGVSRSSVCRLISRGQQRIKSILHFYF